MFLLNYGGVSISVPAAVWAFTAAGLSRESGPLKTVCRRRTKETFPQDCHSRSLGEQGHCSTTVKQVRAWLLMEKLVSTSTLNSTRITIACIVEAT